MTSRLVVSIVLPLLVAGLTIAALWFLLSLVPEALRQVGS